MSALQIAPIALFAEVARKLYMEVKALHFLMVYGGILRAHTTLTNAPYLKPFKAYVVST
ncbi:hypothetical protein D9M70_298390 [compost metagenome]